jgi:Arc/MetJ-type ribon-helix-helix transcriptional regulator
MTSMSMHFIIAARYAQEQLDRESERENAQPMRRGCVAQFRCDQKDFLAAAVESGRFASIDHAIRAGVELLNAVEAERLFPSMIVEPSISLRQEQIVLTLTLDQLEALKERARSPGRF